MGNWAIGLSIVALVFCLIIAGVQFWLFRRIIRSINQGNQFAVHVQEFASDTNAKLFAICRHVGIDVVQYGMNTEPPRENDQIH